MHTSFLHDDFISENVVGLARNVATRKSHGRHGAIRVESQSARLVGSTYQRFFQ